MHHSSARAGTAPHGLQRVWRPLRLLRHLTLGPLQYLCNGLEEDIAARRQGSAQSELDALVAASGKMGLLFKLLPKLRAEGKKVGTTVPRCAHWVLWAGRGWTPW